ncbi:MAG TPA: hypothetical protein PKI19_07090 [Elusimicrobiales bacterium]|nr:hypothetical protein [Elusimicrobiales bacterium]
MKTNSVLILTALLALTAFAVSGPRNRAGGAAGFRDAPNGGAALGALSDKAGGAAGGAVIPVPGEPWLDVRSAPCQKSGSGGVSKQIAKFLAANGEDFDAYAPSCASLEACGPADGYNLHRKVYSVKGELADVFRRFVGQNPRDAWNGTSKFEMGYDRHTRGKFTKASKDIPRIRVGQIFFLTLTLPLHLKIPVVFEVVKNDIKKHEFAFSYVKTNKSIGIQDIAFRQNGDLVEITHTTHFKSGSDFRDKHLYATFHEMLTDDFYENFFSSLSRAETPGAADPSPCSL